MDTNPEELHEYYPNPDIIHTTRFLHYSKVKTALKAFTYSYLDLDLKQFSLGSKRIKIIKRLREECVILKSDKATAIVVMKVVDYKRSLQNLYTGVLKSVQNDNTLTRLQTIQNHLCKLLNHEEISDDQFKTMRPKSAVFGRARALPKIHKPYY